MEKIFDSLKKMIPVFAVIPFLAGTAGYYQTLDTLPGARRVMESMYSSFALYFVNPVSEAYNPLIEIARWSAGFVTTAAILYVLKRFFSAIHERILLNAADSAAVYSDGGHRIRFEDPGRNVIYAGHELKPAAKTHIIMFDSDEESLRFYEENLGRLSDRNVYIRLTEIDFGLMREIGEGKNVSFFDMDGAIARGLWKMIKLWENAGKRENYLVTILGTGHLGQNILNTGLLMNLFSLTQEITYYFVGENDLYRQAHGEIRTLCRDRVLWGSEEDPDFWERIAASDLVIAAELLPVEKLQAIGVAAKQGMVYYYAPEKGGAGSYLKLQNLVPFGDNGEIYTEANICRNASVQAAIDQNFRYILNYGSEEEKAMGKEAAWRKLDGFLQWSNISSVDFGTVLADLGKAGVPLEVMAELEHIRWSRFHYLNYWQYGVPENGAAKDKVKRIHSCLVPYAELSEADKEKDRDVVREAAAEVRVV